MSTLAPPTRKRTARWLCLAAVAAVLAAGCGTAVGYANTFLKLEEAGINSADLSTTDDEVHLAYDSNEEPGDALVEEENKAAEVIWRNLPQRFSTLEVDPQIEDVPAQVYSREELQSRFGPRPSGLDQGSGDIERDARNTFRTIIIGAAIGFAVLLALVIVVIVLVVRAARKRRPPTPTAGWPAAPGGPQAPWPQQPGYGPPPDQQWGAQGQAPVGAQPPAQQWPGQGQPPAQPPPWQPGAGQPAAPYPPPPPSAYGQQGHGGWQQPPTPPAPAEPADAEAETQVLGGEDEPPRPEERRGDPIPPS
ncbi:MAG TPA: hypothetical protein VNK73_05530 [Actinomycetota bacterium]|nr:hypothetical protein [Actinomycetota bacterium]